MLRLVITAILLILLTSCGPNIYAPGGNLIKKGIAIQLEQTQELLKKQLDADFQGFEIKGLSLFKQDAVIVDKLPTYHIQGTYDLIFKLPERQLKEKKKALDLYLQAQKEGKTWRVLLPDKSSNPEKPVWRSYLVK